MSPRRTIPHGPGRRAATTGLLVAIVATMAVWSERAFSLGGQPPAGQTGTSSGRGRGEPVYRTDDAPANADQMEARPERKWGEGEVMVKGTQGAKLGSGEPEYPLISYGAAFQPGNYESYRPRIMGTHGVIGSGHYLATQIGYDMFRANGNAFDAGVAAAMAAKALKMDYAGWVGVGPLILYSAKENKVVTRTGAGTLPALGTLEHFKQHGKTKVNTQLVPADIDVWLSALETYGTMSFEQVALPTAEMVERGYPLYKMQQYIILSDLEGIRKYPYNAKFFLQAEPQGFRVGSIMKNGDLGKTIRYMIDAERKALAAGKSRKEGIRAARDAFYTGEPARAIDKTFKELGGLMRYEDLANYQGKWMAPLHTTYRGYDVYSPSGWSQAPRMILALNILETFDLKSLGYMSADYIHILSQAIDLAFSDSHKWVGDPDFVKMSENLWSKEYGKLRAGLINRNRAFEDMPPWGDPARMLATSPDSPTRFAAPPGQRETGAGRRGGPAEEEKDTTSVNAMDAEGNIFSMTISDPQATTPMIPDWGFGLGSRGTQFNLNPDLANVVAPGKRPRNTNAPFLVMKDGRPFMGLSTPGGDEQVQSLLQVLLDVIEWNMPIEHAVDQPRFGSGNFPGTGGEVNRSPGVLFLENRISAAVVKQLESRGHVMRSWGGWNYLPGAPTLTYRDPKTGLLVAAADVRREAVALGY
jgi:gamma-glutamyltranspeptidase/glutathione hydrolase